MHPDPQTNSSINRQALLSLLFAILALFTFCIGAMPLPMTDLFCYPTTVIFGIGALWMGVTALFQIRKSAENGGMLAKIGIWIGSLTILFVICAITMLIIFFPYLLEFLKSICN